MYVARSVCWEDTRLRKLLLLLLLLLDVAYTNLFSLLEHGSCPPELTACMRRGAFKFCSGIDRISVHMMQNLNPSLMWRVCLPCVTNIKREQHGGGTREPRRSHKKEVGEVERDDNKILELVSM